jgi:methylated-DNA-[protein]-cysteine S-methyltransferase
MHKTISSPIGSLTLHVDDHGALTRIDFAATEATAPLDAGAPANGGGASALAGAASGASDAATALDTWATQLREYFAGERTAFDLPLNARGNAFEQRVWAELARIPYGETASYAEIARRIGRPGAARAVGHANGRNPIAIVVPCHRVIGSDGSLTGYAGGLDAKRALLALEADANA